MGMGFRLLDTPSPLYQIVYISKIQVLCICISNNCRTWILRHTASKLNLEIRSDGYAKVQDLLKLDLYTLADIPLHSHTIADVREV